MIEEVLNWIKKEKLIVRGDVVIVGVSGGADSVCLLLLLLEIREKLGCIVRAVHVEHGIRGEDSRRDAAFVEELCKAQSISLHTYFVNVPEYAKQKGIGLEEAARIKRYECYEKEASGVIQEFSGDITVKIALAHHTDDNAETMLFQMIRGSGIDGLCGMRADRQFLKGVRIIRPLLCVCRYQIEAYLAGRGQTYCTDATNADTDYSRNRIRHEILPGLARINDQAVLHMNQSAVLLGQVADYLAEQTAAAEEKCCSWRDGACILLEEVYREYPHIIRTELIHGLLSKLAGSSKDIGMIHVEMVEELLERQVGREIVLPYHMIVRRVYEGLIFEKGNEASQTENMQEEPGYELSENDWQRLNAGESVAIVLPDANAKLRIIQFTGEISQIHKKKYTKWLDYDKIKCGLRFRRRSGGDYLTVDEAGHKKKLKDYFINEKIPQSMRDKIWILAEQSQVVWVVGGRISACYKIKEDTKRILEIQLSGGNYNED